jgi:trehalose synthase
MLQKVDIAEASIEDYRPIIGDEQVERIKTLAEPLRGARIAHINATQYGGGVSELLRSTIAIERGLGIDAEWRVINGSNRFFEVTKSVHNALQGAEYRLTSEDRETYLLQNNYNAGQLGDDYDVVVIHDPQPAALRHLHGRGHAKWIWRCHIDTSRPNEDVLDFLLPYLMTYDAMVFTMHTFVPAALGSHHVHIIPPAIDPLSPKNFDLPPDQIRRILRWIGVNPDRPLMTQVSRFDPWKDPLGVVRIYRMAREVIPDLQLALLGSMALDDPEGWGLLQQIQDETNADPSVTVATNLTGISNIEVNAFQRHSDVVVQKSIREGFGLIVSETLWKGTPVVAGNTGGIPMQMPEEERDFLVDAQDEETFAARVIQLLTDRELARAVGARGRERTREHFLITRLVAEELELLAEVTAGQSLARSTAQP